MNGRDVVVYAIAGTMLAEAVEFGVMGGVKAAPPGGQLHIEMPTFNTSASAIYPNQMVRLTSTAASTGLSGGWVMIPTSGVNQGEAPVITFPARGQSS